MRNDNSSNFFCFKILCQLEHSNFFFVYACLSATRNLITKNPETSEKTDF